MKTLIRHPAAYAAAFVISFTGLYALYHLAGPALPLYYAALANSVCWFFGLFDPSVSCESNYLLYDDVRELVVVEGCDGVTFVLLILAAVLPFPATWRHKLIGLIWLSAAVLFVNWMRLAILSAVRFYVPAGFDFVHVYLFQPLMIAFTLAIFFLWLSFANDRTSEI